MLETQTSTDVLERVRRDIAQMQRLASFADTDEAREACRQDCVRHARINGVAICATCLRVFAHKGALRSHLVRCSLRGAQ
jgi:hypothetical protein